MRSLSTEKLKTLIKQVLPTCGSDLPSTIPITVDTSAVLMARYRLLAKMTNTTGELRGPGPKSRSEEWRAMVVLTIKATVLNVT